MALHIEEERHRRYSFDQIEKAYPKLKELALAARSIEAAQRSLVENELIRTFENIQLYAHLSHSFQFALPHPDFAINNVTVRQQLGFPPEYNKFSFLDIALSAGELFNLTKGLEKKPEEQWTTADRNLVHVMTNLYHWSNAYQNLPLAIVPDHEPQSEVWLSPWEALQTGLATTAGRNELNYLRSAVTAYWNGQPVEFDLALRQFQHSIRQRVNPKQSAAVEKIPLELTYNHLNLFMWAKLSYALTFIFFLLSLAWERPFWHRLAWGSLGLAVVAHALGIMMRIIILARPPVSTLYETFIFVGLVSVLIGVIMERVNKQWLGLVVASISGFVLLFIAGKFSAEGDTLKMLVAVLNSNFWLSTHVLSISTGYAGCCVAGIVGHIFIIQAIRKPERKLLENTYRNLIGTLGFGLTMTFLGTNLGGIWADQSWGRFWGWDPKENGAMLIIIWCAMLFHAKIGRLIGPLGLAVGTVLGMVVVLWAWFGVNLLSVGLHSYGFTSGLARNLTIYVSAEIIFLIIGVPLARRGFQRLK